MSKSLARVAGTADRWKTGLSREVLTGLRPALAGVSGCATDRPRRRAVGAGARHRLVLVDRLLPLWCPMPAKSRVAPVGSRHRGPAPEVGDDSLEP